MFNIMILDVAIGMIFIYLLLSLMCSAANEIIELLLKKRAIDLEKGIRELLVPDGKSGKNDIVEALYDHPLINGLFVGKYDGSRISKLRSYVWRTHLPSYIPSRNFALAVMDLIKPGVTPEGKDNGPSGATGATAGPPLPESPSQVVVNLAGVAPPAVDAAAEAVPDPAVGALRAALVAPLPNAGAPAAGLAANNPQITDQMRRALIPLIDAAGNDMIKVRENIEAWFDTSMQRVSGWYKKRTQVTLMILGLFIAISVNVDTVTIVKRLSTDKPLRESLVAAADAYSKANAQATPTPTPSPGSTPAPTPQVLTQVCTKDSASDDCKRLTEACTDPNSPKCKYALNLYQINSLGLPIGWDSTISKQPDWPAWRFKGPEGWWNQIYSHLFGWLLTALAISLGAPFWFDLLSKFMAVRSAVKPQEKSSGTG